MSEHWTPRPYQARAVKKMISEASHGLFLQTGLGKTSISLAAFEVLRRRGFVKKLLVVAPLRPIQITWPAEVARWREFEHLRVATLHGPKKARALRSESDVYLINYEGLNWLASQPPELWPDMLVCDESTKLKHARTQRFKTIREMLPRFSRRYILTGTPAPNGLIDLFGQIYVLDFGRALGRYITHYRREFFYQSGFGGYSWSLVPGGEEKIRERIAPLVTYMGARDHVDLPPIVSNTITVPFPGEMRALYDKMKRELIISLRSGRATARNAGVLTTKLRQLVGGAIYIDEEGLVEPEKRRWGRVHDAKIEALEELIEELSGQPLLVAYEYDHERERLEERLKAPSFRGSQSRVRELEVSWNRGEIPVLLVHPASAAHGLNLQRGGSTLAWYALPWNLEHYDQMIDRIWRSGQERTVFVHHLVVQGTIDNTITRALRTKATTQSALLAALKEDFSA